MRVMKTSANATTIALAAALVFPGCASTVFTSTWRAPATAPVTLAGKRVAAMVVTPNDGTRRAAEDVLARELTARGAEGVASYTLFEGRNASDQDAARSAMQKAGVDGVVVMRPTGKDTEVTYTPGMWTARPVYGSFWGGYYRYGWGAAYQPGYLQTDTVVTVETLVYTLADDKLIWAGTSRTTNPSRLDGFVRELAGKVADEMRSEGVLR